MDQRGNTEGGNQDVLAAVAIEVLAVDVALDVARQGVLRPSPIDKGAAVELQLL